MKLFSKYPKQMGIPSYYKKLLDTNPGLVTKSHPDTQIQWLFMDFNCLIYHCLHREDTPVYPCHSEKESWEKEFIECIVRYCLKVIRIVDPKQGVFIAMDGVVPMAKMKQQRLRRFKSAWLSKHSKESNLPKWDTNSIWNSFYESSTFCNSYNDFYLWKRFVDL